MKCVVLEMIVILSNMGDCESRHAEIANTIVRQSQLCKPSKKQSELVIDLKPIEEEPSTSNTIPEIETSKEKETGQRGDSNRGRNEVTDSRTSGTIFNSMSSIRKTGHHFDVAGPSEGLNDSVLNRWNEPDYDPNELFTSQHLNQIFKDNSKA